jgi:uncharacterized membrane protein HdeD (DUF308 family)
MSDPTGSSRAEQMHHLHRRAGWVIALGIIALLGGGVALGSVVMATAYAVTIVGIMMVVAGVTEVFAAFGTRTWDRFLFWLLLGLLYFFGGLICLFDPFRAATILTLALGAALIVAGILRIFLATQMRHGTPWGWVALSGVLSFLLGLVIVSHWPASSFYILGMLLGIDLIFIGGTWLAVGLALRRASAG